MESSLKVYLIGMVVGFATLMLSAQEINEDTFSSTANFIKGIGIVVASVWLFFYMAMILISLPFLAIEPLKKIFYKKEVPTISIHGWLFDTFYYNEIDFNAESIFLN